MTYQKSKKTELSHVLKKTLEQQLASAQMRLNRLQHKSKQETKQIETRQKIILGAEVAKALDCDVFTVDKELVLGMLLETPNLHPDDKVRFRKNGLLFLASMKGRKT
ncbi:conjugal transfer protein TraD [Klebsiella pneumoniae]|uniref:Conjugal transfer protein TraD n=1 Tax=Klebsiella pneumoniae TaxID=573 RepID=A0A927DKV5_KLEPN|nr:conjugal transfer protein TraD [Klebsiella pneumoniae]MBD3709010.1 conjugal transfer protein TraD [Klebsiella pneumoniae]MBD3720238.1 conjugal transfer protein TraD [Klebsiella pneumoniae]